MNIIDILKLEAKHNQQKLEREIREMEYKRKEERILEQVQIAVVASHVEFYKELIKANNNRSWSK